MSSRASMHRVLRSTVDRTTLSRPWRRRESVDVEPPCIRRYVATTSGSSVRGRTRRSSSGGGAVPAAPGQAMAGARQGPVAGPSVRREGDRTQMASNDTRVINRRCCGVRLTAAGEHTEPRFCEGQARAAVPWSPSAGTQRARAGVRVCVCARVCAKSVRHIFCLICTCLVLCALDRIWINSVCTHVCTYVCMYVCMYV